MKSFKRTFTRLFHGRHRKSRLRQEPFYPRLEPLEMRMLLSADAAFRSFENSVFFASDLLAKINLPAELIRTIAGTGNNRMQVQWGSTDEQLLRVGPVDYGDGISTPGGVGRENARVISNTINAHDSEEIPNDRNLTAYIYAFGQFLDHDLDLTESSTTGQESFNISVPQGDPIFAPGSDMPFNRAKFDPTTGTSTSNPRQQINQVTAWIDGSMIYGSDAETAAGLRTFSGGKLKTSDGDLLPTDANGYFLAGDGRVNENIELTALQTLFMREHNLWADRIAKANPLFTDEQIYQNARAIVGAEIQVITYKEFLPALLGPNALSRYKGYDPTVNPNIATEFSSAGFRLGHSLLNDEVEFFDNDSQPVHDEILLREAFGNPALIKETGIDPLLKYLASVKSEELDIRIVDSLRNFLSDPPAVLDLAAVNIQRGRDVGLADYNSTREAYGLKAVRKFSDITSDKEVQSQLRQLYGSVDNIDLWVGALAEDHVPGGSVGPLLRAILTDQFERLRDGDRLWYQKIFSGRTLSLLEDTSLADIIKRNSTVNNVQDNAFLLKVSISGQVLLSSSSKAFDIGFNNDFFGDRFPNPFTQPIGLARVAVELLNDEGEVVARTVTDRSGRYSFVNMLRETGNYQVRIIVPNGLQIDDNYIDMSITTGDMIYRGLNFLLSRSRGGDAK